LIGSEHRLNQPAIMTSGVRSTTGEGLPGVRAQVSWALFDFARSPYLSLVYIFVFPSYFANTIVGDPVRGQEAWSVANAIVGVVVALCAPVLGAISDRTGRRKPWLVTIVVVMAICCMLLWYSMPGARSGLSISMILMLIVILAACFQFTEVFYNAFLPSIIAPQRIGLLSGIGISTAQAGTFICLIVILFGVALPATGETMGGLLPSVPLFGLNPAREEHNRIAGPVAGLWLMIFSIPLMLWTPDSPPTGVPLRRALSEGLSQLSVTLRRARELKNVGLFLLARMLYTDGKVAILAYSGIYATGVFGWHMVSILLFAVSLSPFSILGGLLGGWLDDRIGPKRALQISIVVCSICLFVALSCTKNQLFFRPYDVALAKPVWSFPYFRTLPEIVVITFIMLMGAGITAAFAISRTFMARIAPLSMINQFFGLYALSGTATGFLGHATVGLFTGLFASQRAGFASPLILLFAGGTLLSWVKLERAPDIIEPRQSAPSG
jgi:UMF1 family MFS transporter